MKHIYLLSGLGVDDRVFEHLVFPYPHTFIQWVMPLADETMQAYAKRLTVQITQANPILIGLSFGGMMSIEIAKIIAVEKIILLASAKTKAEIPLYYRSVGVIHAENILPFNLLQNNNRLTTWFFGITDEAQKQLLTAILKDTNIDILRWSIHQIINWNNAMTPLNIVHIHGDADRILPIKNVKADYIIKGGGHFMTMNQYQEINELLQKIILAQLP
jgi:pimeloyl-ACP methyl ester carboxylesterase